MTVERHLFKREFLYDSLVSITLINQQDKKLKKKIYY